MGLSFREAWKYGGDKDDTSGRIKWTWYWFEEKFVKPWYIPVHNFFYPHNVQKIRNCPRSWNDRSECVFHCVFSMLCDFIEREEGGRNNVFEGIENHREYLAELLAREENNNMARGEAAMLTHQIERETEQLRLYDWYMGVNWNEPVGFPWSEERSEEYFAAQDVFEELCQENLLSAIKTRQGWWT